MTLDEATLARIVAEVVRRLQLAAAGPAPVEPAAALPPCPTSLQWQGRVLTLEALSGRLAGVAQLRVPPRTVITPAARDELRARRIELVVTDQVAPPSDIRARLLIVDLVPRGDWESIVAASRGRLAEVRTATETCPVRAAQAAAAAVTDGQGLAVIATSEPAAACCLANRRSHVRAVCCEDPTAVPPLVESLAANVLVINPQRLSEAQLQPLVDRFVGDGRPRHCPERLVRWLG